MKIVRFYLLLIVFLILAGCSQRELTFDRKYPDTTKIDEFREKRQFEIEEEMRNLPKKILETSARPRSLEIMTKKMLIPLDANQYCWDLNYLDCERMTPVHPSDIRNFNIHILNARTNELIEVSVAEDPINFPTPVRIEVYLFDENRSLDLFQTLESTSNNFDFRVPTEPGMYTFLFKVIYQSEIDGIAYHSLKVYVY